MLVFSAFVDPLLALQRQCPGALLTGRQAIRQRQHEVDAFQAGECSLLLAAYGAAGLGLTLHRAERVVLLERPWTPGDTEQAEDRCHRIGMKGPLECHWLQLGEVDRFVDELIASKSERIAEALPGSSFRQAAKGVDRAIGVLVTAAELVGVPMIELRSRGARVASSVEGRVEIAFLTPEQRTEIAATFRIPRGVIYHGLSDHHGRVRG